jgi:hypothetical protein
LNNKIALQYYGNLSNSNQTIYTDIVQSADIEECCLLCLESDKCFSFDFNILSDSCGISSFSAGDTGGLDRNAHGWSHYARKSVTTPPNSVLRINGISTVMGSGILGIYIDTEFGTKSHFSSLDTTSINFHSNVRTSRSFQTELCGGRLTFAASDSELGSGSISGSGFSGPPSIGDGLTLNYSASILYKD